MVKEKNYALYTLVISMLTASIIFGYFIIKGHGIFTVVDDFNVQQITFATAAYKAIHEGKLSSWIWNLDLGSSVITGFSFYDLGSPFFWIMLLFPKKAIPYMMGFFYILKYMIASITAFYYLKMFVKEEKFAVLGALMYAFSGYQTVNLMYYHFHDVVALFPLLMIGIEKLLREKKIAGFIAGIFINCLVNYFFFVEEVVFLGLYFIVRNLSSRHSFKEIVMNLGRCILAGIIGISMAAMLFLPNIIYILANNRSKSEIYLSNIVYSSDNLLYILKGIILPGEAMQGNSVIVEHNWNSTSCYLPFAGIAFTVAYVMKKKDWLSKFIILLSIITLSPILQSMFLLFTEANQRWWFMGSLMLVLATICVMEDYKEYDLNKTCMINIIIVAMFYFLLRYAKWSATNETAVIYKDRFLLYTVITIAGPCVIILLKKYNLMKWNMLISVIPLFCILTTMITLHYYRESANTDEELEKYQLGMQLEIPDVQYRYNSTDNILMLMGKANGIGVFSSTIENSSREFDKLFGYYSSNTTEYRSTGEIPGLSELLAGKYEIVKDEMPKEYSSTYKTNSGNYYITERNACPIGFAVNEYIVLDDLWNVPITKKASVMMEAAVIDKKDVEGVDGAFKQLEWGEIENIASIDDLINSTVDNAVKNFQRDSKGFTCTTEYSEDKLVYFSIPYDRGWSAYMDKEKIQILNSGGMMVVKIPKGTHKLEFKFHTVGFKEGLLISGIAFLVFIWVKKYEIDNIILLKGKNKD